MEITCELESGWFVKPGRDDPSKLSRSPLAAAVVDVLVSAAVEVAVVGADFCRPIQDIFAVSGLR